MLIFYQIPETSTPLWAQSNLAFSLKEPNLNADSKGYSFPWPCLLSVMKTTFDSEGLWNCFPKGMFPFLSLLPCLPGIKLFWSSSQDTRQSMLAQSRWGKLLLPGQSICSEVPWVWNTEMGSELFSPGQQNWGLLAKKAAPQGPGSAQHRTQGREYLTPENHLDRQKTALPCSKDPVLPGERGVSGMLRGSVTSTARASREPQVCVGSCFVMGKKVQQQSRDVVGNVCHKGEIRTHTHVHVGGNRTNLVYGQKCW